MSDPNLPKPFPELQRAVEAIDRGRVLSDYERGWLDSFIEGEGCLYFGFRWDRKRAGIHSFAVRIVVGNTSRPFMEKACSIVPTKIYDYRPRHSVASARKKAYELHWFGDTLRWILPQLRFTDKEEQRILMLEVLNLLDERRKMRPQDFPEEKKKRLDEIEKRFRVLNRRGR